LNAYPHLAEDHGGRGGGGGPRGHARFAGAIPWPQGRLILCGGNIDPRILASIMVRELEREHRIVSFRLTIADRPGVLGPIATLLGRLGANILEVDHRRLFLDVPPRAPSSTSPSRRATAPTARRSCWLCRRGGYQPVHITTGDAID